MTTSDSYQVLLQMAVDDSILDSEIPKKDLPIEVAVDGSGLIPLGMDKGTFVFVRGNALAALNKVTAKFLKANEELRNAMSHDGLFKLIEVCYTPFAINYRTSRERLSKKAARHFLNELRKALVKTQVTKTHCIPCYIFFNDTPSFSVGPVRFIRLQDWCDNLSLSPMDKITAEPGIRLLSEFNVMAEIDITANEAQRSYERACAAIDTVLTVFTMLFGSDTVHRVGRNTGYLKQNEYSTWEKETPSAQPRCGIHGHGRGILVVTKDIPSYLEKWKSVLDSAGGCIRSFVENVTSQLPTKSLDTRWVEAVYWYGQACKSQYPGVSLAMLEVAMAVLTQARQSTVAYGRLVDLGKRWLNRHPNDQLFPLYRQTYEEFVAEFERVRAEVLHGNRGSFFETDDTIYHRADVVMRQILLICALRLNQYAASHAPIDDWEGFLSWDEAAPFKV